MFSKEWIYLFIAIALEVVSTAALKFSDGFTKLVPSLVVIIGYCVAFYFLSLTLKAIPIGVAYAVWSGVGIALITFFGWIFLGQHLHPMAIVGIGFILVGIIMLNIFSMA